MNRHKRARSYVVADSVIAPVVEVLDAIEIHCPPGRLVQKLYGGYNICSAGVSLCKTLDCIEGLLNSISLQPVCWPVTTTVVKAIL